MCTEGNSCVLTKCRHWTVSEAELMYHTSYGGFICATSWCFELQRQGDILKNEWSQVCGKQYGEKTVMMQ